MDKRKRYWKQRRKLCVDLLGGTCVNCGTDKNLEIDHVIPEDKSFSFGSGYLELKLETVLKELQKCQLLCVNCHKDKTFTDLGYGKIKHGQPSMYTNQKCRCNICRTSWANYIRQRRIIIN